MKENKSRLAYVSLLLSMLIWAASGIAIKSALTAFSPLLLVVSRFTLSVAIMFIIGVIFRKNSFLGLNKIEKKDIKYFVLGGFFQPFLYYILDTYCYVCLSSPTIAEALLSGSPLLTPLFAFVLLREKISGKTLLGIGISTLGMLLVVLNVNLFGDDFDIGNAWGVPIAFFAVVMAVLYTVVLKKIPSKYNTPSVVFYVQLFSLAFFYPTWLLQDGFDGVRALLQTSASTLRPSLYALGYLALFSSVIAYILFCYAVRIVGVTKANAFNNMRPVFTALIMFVGFHEMLPIAKWIGILLIVGGLFLVNKSR